MMRLQTSVIRSRVGRRIFFLFIACALLPIVVLGLLSFTQVSSQLRDTGLADLLSTDKSYTMELMGRLETLNAEFNLMGTSRGFSTQPPARRVPATSSDRWRALTLLSDRSALVISGHPIQPPVFSPQQQQFLRQGQTVLAVSKSPSPQVAFFRLLDASDPQLGLLAGLADSKYLFAEDTIPANTKLRIRDASGQILFCSSSPRVCTLPFNRYNSSSGTFESREGGMHVFGAYSGLFLRGSFMSDPWTIVFTRDADTVLAPARSFRRTFPLVVLLALWVVLLLSLIQIRRTLVPLETLRTAARQIAQQKFDTSVSLNSGDEFEELGDAINSMAADLGKQFDHLQRFHWGTLTALARAIDAKSTWTAGHSERVTRMAIRIATAMNLPAQELETIQRGGLLHDIGKLGTPPDILDKPGRLTPEEMQIMRDHVLTGVRILEPIPDFAPALPIVAQHHECLDGSGYPYGLSGDQICLNARILSVADCYDALISDRPYRSGMPLVKVVEILNDGAGTKFDPEVIHAFHHVMATETGDTRSHQPSAGTSPAIGTQNAASLPILAQRAEDLASP